MPMDQAWGCTLREYYIIYVEQLRAKGIEPPKFMHADDVHEFEDYLRGKGFLKDSLPNFSLVTGYMNRVALELLQRLKTTRLPESQATWFPIRFGKKFS